MMTHKKFAIEIILLFLWKFLDDPPTTPHHTFLVTSVYDVAISFQTLVFTDHNVFSGTLNLLSLRS